VRRKHVYGSEIPRTQERLELPGRHAEIATDLEGDSLELGEPPSR
jgi:hypothetical protein